MLAVEKLLNASPGHLGPAVRADADSYPYSYICILLVRQRFARQPRAYSELSAVLGGQVPDLRGLFLRGHGSQAHIQDNGSTVGVTSTLHESGQLGEVQGDATRHLSGSLSTGQMNAPVSGPFGHRTISNGAHWMGEYASGVSLVEKFIDTARVTPTANENRPANQAVRYLIRARP